MPPKFPPNSHEARANAFSFFGFTDLPTISERGSTVLTHGQGPYVFDVHGRKYMDANSGLWNMVAGFDHPGLIEAAKAQYDRFPGYHAFFGRMSDQTVALSEKLIEVSPFSSGKVFYTNSGSEANDTMVKMLWMLAELEDCPQRRKILTRKNAYHGVTAISASMTGKPYNTTFGLPLPEFHHLSCPHFWREGKAGEDEATFSARLAQELENTILFEGPETIAGFFAEPVLGAGGVIPPPRGYFQAIQAVLRKYAIPFISDEVICGFGRTGSVWGCETYDFQPDVIISSKNLTAGYFPMGAVILGAEMAERLEAACLRIDEFPHGFTASGHPVGAAIALKAIDVILNEGLLENVQTVGGHFMKHLTALADFPHIGEARGIGLMGALEVVLDKADKTPFAPEISISEKIANACTDLGLICRPLGASIVLCPPFICTHSHIDEIFDKLQAALKSVFDTVKTQ